MTLSNSTPPVLQSIFDICDRLRSLSQQDVQATWHRCPTAAGDNQPPPWHTDWPTWPLAALNHHRHIPWERGAAALWLHQQFTWPEQGQGYSLRGLSAKLAVRWWADQAEIYINGILAHRGDLFDCWTRLALTEQVNPGESVEISLKLISPSHDDGALVKSVLVFESQDAANPEPAFVADELAVLAIYSNQFAPNQMEVLGEALTAIAWEAVGDRSRFNHSLTQLRTTLQCFTPWLKQRTIHCLGHAHLDLAWLWPVADTWEAAERTFQSVLALQQDFPELTFTHSSPALLAWLEHHRPQLFKALHQQVKAQRWAIDAGLWVEPDLNLPGGEALVRQILYGQRYCAEKFGAISAIAWLPDTFGFSWQLPQLLHLGGVRFFATQKLSWNDTNHFPHRLFTWQGLDGTPITAVMLPPIGTDIEPVEMAQYACQWEDSTGLPDCLWLPGVGDHGGGPTRDMLQKARRWAHSPLFPNLTFSHAAPLFEAMVGQRWREPETDLPDLKPHDLPPTTPTLSPSLVLSTASPLPLWNDELYLELHRGCYTTHGDQKHYNRRCEDRLFEAELLAAIAALLGLQTYPQAQLEQAWKQVLFNQFHDILPGSSIPAVFEQANQDWQAALATGQQIVQDSLGAIGRACSLASPPRAGAIPVLLFNPLNWARDEVVAVPLEGELAQGANWLAQDALGNPLPIQMSWSSHLQGLGAKVGDIQLPQSPENEQSGCPDAHPPEPPLLWVTVPNLPSVGYRTIWLSPTDTPAPTPAFPPEWVLENQHLRVVIDGATGQIASLYHKGTGTETLSGPGNQLQAFQDQGQYWDAWNIAPDYQAHPLEAFQLDHIDWVEYGPCQQSIRVVRRFNQSTFVQTYRLGDRSPYLGVHTTAHWQETQVVVKAAFPCSVVAPAATYEIPFGAIQRSTTGQTSQAKAKWEVPALRWADLSQEASSDEREPTGPRGGDRGISLLTDYKHGFDVTPSQLRLTLLKAPLWPDPTADRGYHTFTYAIYPHAHSWQRARTVQLARNLNFPIQCWIGPPSTGQTETRRLPDAISFLDLGDTSLVLSALKQSETNPDEYILRGYESAGEKNLLRLDGELPLKIIEAVDLLEQTIASAGPGEQSPSGTLAAQEPTSLAINPWKVVSLRLRRAEPQSGG